jgi:hypothetical protein
MLPFRLLVPLALLSLAAMPAHAGTLAEAAVRDAFAGGTFTPISPSCIDGGSGETEAEVICDEDDNHGWGRARADYGSLESYAELWSTSPPADNKNYQAYGWARFEDRLSIESGILTTGEWTDARMVIDLSGIVDEYDAPTWMELGDLFATWTFTVMIDGLEVQPSNGPLTLDGEFWYDFDFRYGNEVNVSAELITDVRCFGCDVSYGGVVNFFGTASVTALALPSLDPGDYTVASLDGASYANVVPEPSTALLLSLGLASLALRRRLAA